MSLELQTILTTFKFACVVHHESLEIWFGIAMFNHCVIELYPHHLLHFDVFKLCVANCNGHDFAIHQITYMAHLVQSMTRLIWSSMIKEFPNLP